MIPEASTKEANILFLTSDGELKNFLQTLLEGEGYAVEACGNNENLFGQIRNKKIDCLIFDFNTGGILELCKKIRYDFSLRYIPIIVIVEKEDTINKIKGIYAGADDYMEKPITAGELLARIKANLWRADRDLDANPLSKLPGNVSILKEIERRLKNNEKFCAAYADLSKFKEYNDYYGFEWGDKIIIHTAAIITNTLFELGTGNDFLGHIGGDDFFFFTLWENIKNVCEKIIEDFDKTIISFYKKDDIKRGGIYVKNRVGKISQLPVMSIAVGVATNQLRPLCHVGEVIQIATELKTYAKTFSRSIYIIDRRKSVAG